jgi:FdhD protein
MNNPEQHNSVSPVATVNKFRMSKQDDALLRTASRDVVSVEEPLQISLVWTDESHKEQEKVFTVTMRTPGNDAELAIGLLNSEGIIRSYSDVIKAEHSFEDGIITGNQINVFLATGVFPDWKQYQRHLTTQSSCGVCGKTSLQSIEMKEPPKLNGQNGWLNTKTILTLSDVMRELQEQFQLTGGVHAVGLFNQNGKLEQIREDVGRHNAMDKLIGVNLQQQSLNNGADELKVVVLSGRISFELVQKAVMAKFPVIVAVGAPSSLAISLAQRFNMTIIGFVSHKGFNIYHGGWRLNNTV